MAFEPRIAGPANILPQHLRTIERLVRTFEDDPSYLALIVAGSVVKGLAQDSSDVDFMLIATDSEYARRKCDNDFQWFSTELCDYEGGYVDGKVIDLSFLCEVVEKGCETARSAFLGAFVPWARDGYHELIEDLVAQAQAYQETERPGKLQAFHAQMEAMKWYMGEAAKRGNAYLAHRTAADMVLFGFRMILAHNRVLYPYHKWLVAFVERCPDKPEGIVELGNALMASPSVSTCNAFYDAIMGFADWEAAPEGWPSRFMEDSEWHWRRGLAPIADR